MIISFGHFKGGTGKTTTCLNIAGYLARFGSRVLAIDLDPQVNLAAGLGIYGYDNLKSSKKRLEESIVTSSITNLHIAATQPEDQRNSRVDVIRRAIRKIRRRYDFILIDLPPSHRRSASKGVLCADKNIVVLEPGVFSLKGIERYKDILKSNKSKAAMGVINRFHSGWSPFRKNHALQIRKEAESLLGIVYEIPYSHHIYESQKRGVPISHHKPYSRVGTAYMRIAEKILSDSGN